MELLPGSSKGSRWRLGAISRNLAGLEDHQRSYLSIHDQPAIPLKVEDFGLPTWQPPDGHTEGKSTSAIWDKRSMDKVVL
ncbi:hypothetical protein Tco_0991151 [Tanacetum coccineum]|uniref:Uncharacterized protein n=1 Tax=Tanacetum coccineum TaxID=301880 RepID=A0ABQ5F060_9ASTR